MMDWVWIAKAAGKYGISYPTNSSLEAFLESIGATVETGEFQQTLKTPSSVKDEYTLDYMRGYGDGYKDGLASPVAAYAPKREQQTVITFGPVNLLPSGSTFKPCKKHPDRYCNCEGFAPACWDGHASTVECSK